MAGLGHFAGRCERFPALFEGAELKSPHVGWNSLERFGRIRGCCVG